MKYYSLIGNVELETLSYIYPTLRMMKNNRFTPENMIILMDGVCMFVYADFSKFLSQKRLGPTVMFGDTVYYPDNIKSDIGDACSEEVVTVDDVYRKLEHIKSTSSLPKRFKRIGGLIKYPVGVEYSVNKKEDDSVMEFKIIEPDYIANDYIDYDNLRESNYLTILSLYVNSYFDKCVLWQIKSNSSCTETSEGSKMDHAIYGNPCDSVSSTYNLNRCGISGCEEGYCLKNENCLKIAEIAVD